MIILHIQHAVPVFDQWKRAFGNDPLNRKEPGVRRHDIFRSVTDTNFVMIDLEFESTAEAEKMLEKLRQLWAGIGSAAMRDPVAWIIESVESRML